MEFLECGHATNDKREYCEVCRQRFNELEYGAPKYKDMGPYGYGCMGRHIWVHIWHGPSYGCGRTGPHMDMGAREPYGYGCMGPHMDMGAWVLIYGCIYGMGHHMDIGVLEAYSLIRLIADEIECESVVLFSSGDRR